MKNKFLYEYFFYFKENYFLCLKKLELSNAFQHWKQKNAKVKLIFLPGVSKVSLKPERSKPGNSFSRTTFAQSNLEGTGNRMKYECLLWDEHTMGMEIPEGTG